MATFQHTGRSSQRSGTARSQASGSQSQRSISTPGRSGVSRPSSMVNIAAPGPSPRFSAPSMASEVEGSQPHTARSSTASSVAGRSSVPSPRFASRQNMASQASPNATLRSVGSAAALSNAGGSDTRGSRAGGSEGGTSRASAPKHSQRSHSTPSGGRLTARSARSSVGSFKPPSRTKQEASGHEAASSTADTASMAGAFDRPDLNTQRSERFKDLPERVIRPQKPAVESFGHAAGAGRRKEDLRAARTRVDNHAAVENAAGVHSSKQNKAPDNQSKKIVKPSDNKNFHVGLTKHTTDEAAGVYDFNPTAQGRVARSAPKRRSQVGELLGNQLPAEHQAPVQFEAAYQGAAGMSAGHWADARYASTTAWA